MTVPPGPGTIAVVTVNWNGWKMTLECLAALRASRDADWHLVIVDNASSDDSRDHLRDLGDDVTLLASPVNGGWTGGNNMGVEWALAAGHEWLFILNNDAFVEPETLGRLRAVHTAVGGSAAIGPVHLTADGKDYDFLGMVDDAATGFPHWLPPQETDVTALPDPLPVVAIKGAGIFVDAASFKRVGRFDDQYYLNWDEVDWCFTARERGVPLFMTRTARIIHAGSASIGGHESALQTYFMARNSLLFARKHCSVRQRILHLRRLYWEARRRARAHRPGARWILGFLRSDTPDERAFKRGVADFFLGRFGECPTEIRRLSRS